MFDSQSFTIPGMSMAAPGASFLDLAFGLSNVKPWRLIGALFGWIFCFRFIHYFFFTLESWPYLKAPSMETRSKKKAAKTDSIPVKPSKTIHSHRNP